MASSSNTTSDYFSSSRPALRPRPAGSTTTPAKVASPLTPLLNRSISSQYNSPGASSFRGDQEEHIIYELGARHLSAGFAGESRPRCIHFFNREDGRRVGDYRTCDPTYKGHRRKRRRRSQQDEEGEAWSEAEEVELYRNNVRDLDLGLVEDRLERVIRNVHTDHLQLDQKSRKAVLLVPSLLPTPIAEIALKVLFQHYAQPAAVMLLTTPLLACVGAGLRNGLVVDVGWQETVVTAVGEYREVASRRSVRAGKRVIKEMARMLEEEAKNQLEHIGTEDVNFDVSFVYADEVARRMAWCRPRPPSSSSGDDEETTQMMKIPSPSPGDSRHLHIPFTRFSNPAQTALFPVSPESCDDHDLPLPNLAYRVLLALSPDLRGLCTSRIIITGGLSNLPGLKSRLLHELSVLIEARGWDIVHSYGSADDRPSGILRERNANIQRASLTASPGSTSIVKSGAIVTRGERLPDDVYPRVPKQAISESRRGKVDKVDLRAVDSCGAWSGASILASLRIKGVHEIERDDFLKHGLRDEGAVVL